MTFLQRIRNLWALSAYRVDGEFIVPGLQGQMPKLINASRPKGKATIVETRPVDPFNND